jgi:hypothetical protein
MTPNFEEILLELSYRVPSGIVDLTNEEHIVELESILRENGISNFNAISRLREKVKKTPKVKNLVKSPKQDLQKTLDTTFENPETKKMVKVSSALGYDKTSQAYKMAKAMFTQAGHKMSDISMVDTAPGDEEQPVNAFGVKGGGANVFEPQTTTTTSNKFSDVVDGLGNVRNKEKNLQNTIQAQTSILDTLDKFSKSKGNPYAAEHKQVAEIAKKIFNGEKISPAEQKLAAQYIRVAEPTENNPNATKFYIAKQPGNWKNQGPTARVRVYVGAKDSSNPVHGAFGQYVRKYGMAELSPSTFGGKLSTANQTYVDNNGKTRLLKNASKVKESNGVVTNVQIGAMNIVRIDPKTAKTDKERKAIEKNNRTLDEYAEKIKAGDLDFIDMDSGTIPDSPENRVKVIKESISGMALRFKGLADKALITDKETLGLIDTLGNFSKKDPNKDPAAWSKEFETILSNIANHEGEPSLKEGWANYAEIFVAIREMHDNGRGTQNGKCALLPQSTTLETVDVITVSNGKGENRIVTLDGRSVKKGIGGASGLASKCKKSTYKNDPKGLIKKGVTELAEAHGKPFELKLDAPLAQHKQLNKQYQEELKQKAAKLNVSPQFIARIENELKKGGNGASKVTSALAKVVLEREKAGLDVSNDTIATLRLRLESRYMYTELAHEAYNTNVDVQDFSNDSVLSQKEDRGGSKLVKEHRILIDSSDGIDILAYPKPEFNIGFDLEGRSRNPGAGRFHNEKKRV